VSTVNCAEPKGVVVDSCLYKHRRAIYSLILHFQRKKVSTNYIQQCEAGATMAM
jgi:hypothetical protein